MHELTTKDVVVHREPVWRSRANFMIVGDTADADDPEPTKRWEQLWARKAGENRYELCCIPFFMYNLALGDIVACHQAEGHQYVIHEVVEPSGHVTFRIWFGESTVAGIRAEAEQALIDLGAAVEWSSTNLLAVDATDAEHAQKVISYIHPRAQRSELEYERGYGA